jgi:hypothetical protein
LSQEQSAAATMAYSRAGGNETLNASNLGLPPVVGRPLGRPSIEKGHEDFNRKWMKGCWHIGQHTSSFSHFGLLDLPNRTIQEAAL